MRGNMTEPSIPPAFSIALFLIGFPLLWLFVTGLLSYLSGWRSLAKKFRADVPPSGDSYRFVSGSLGMRIFPVNYSTCLFVTVAPAGIHLSILFLFRFLSPPLLIPWKSIESVVDSRILFFDRARISIRDSWPTLTIYGRAGRAILTKMNKGGGSGS